MSGISTGYPILDKQIDGMIPGTVLFIAARKKMGKSTLLTNIAAYDAFKNIDSKILLQRVVKKLHDFGFVIVNVDFYSKGKIIDEICEKFKVTRENIVVVGDSEVDIPMMRKSCFSIAFNSSSYKVVSISDIAIYSSSLRILYPIFKKLLST